MLYNRISPERLGIDSTRAMLMWNDTLFDGMEVPDGMDRDQIITHILLRVGEKPLVHPNPEWLASAITNWSKIRVSIWNKLVETLNYDYNPIHNYDRTETIEDVANDKRVSEMSQDVTGSGTSTNGNEHTVSAENVETYQPDSKDNNNAEYNDLQQTENTVNDNLNRTYSRTAHMEGNIGVTTTQQMIQAERDIVNFSVYDVIVNDYDKEFCLGVW